MGDQEWVLILGNFERGEVKYKSGVVFPAY